MHREILSYIRHAKSSAKKTLKWPVEALVIRGSEKDTSIVKEVLPDVARAGKFVPEAVSIEYDNNLGAEQRFEVNVTLSSTFEE